MKNVTYYKRKIKDYIILAKIEHDNGSYNGLRYENGKWIDYRRILDELVEDQGFDIITEEEAKEIMKGLDKNDI